MFMCVCVCVCVCVCMRACVRAWLTRAIAFCSPKNTKGRNSDIELTNDLLEEFSTLVPVFSGLYIIAVPTK